MAGWTDLPRGITSVPLRGDARTAMLGFFERRFWSDPALKNVCYVYPPAAMAAEYRAAVVSAGRSYIVDADFVRKIVRSCSKPIVVFVAKFENAGRQSWQLIFADRSKRTADMTWIGGSALTVKEQQDAAGFLAVTILPILDRRKTGGGTITSRPAWTTVSATTSNTRPNCAGFGPAPKTLVRRPTTTNLVPTITTTPTINNPKPTKTAGADWTVRPADNVCGPLGVSKDSFSCALIDAAVLYLRSANPGTTTAAAIQRILSECRKPRPPGTTGCPYLIDFGRALLKEGAIDGSTGLPAFRNVPLATIDPATYNKYQQTSIAQSLWLQHVAWQLEQETGGRLICYRPSDADENPADNELMVVDPIVLKQYPDVSNRVSESLISTINRCTERFFIASLHIRYQRDTPELIAEGRRIAGQPGWTRVEAISHGHANILLFDIRSKIVFLFEPNGPPQTDDQERQSAFVENFVKNDVLPSLSDRYEFRSGAGSCPYIPGAQALQQHTGIGGYCASWSSLFSTLLLLNPDWPIESILQRMTTAGEPPTAVPLNRKERGKKLLDYIQRFTAAMDCIVPPEAETRSIAERSAIVKAMRLANLLPPRVCTDVRKAGDLNEILFFEDDDDGSPVLLAARNDCGAWLVLSQPLLAFDNLADRNQTGQAPFRRLDRSSGDARQFLSASRRPAGSGRGSRSDPFVLANDGKSASELVTAIKAAASYGKARRIVADNLRRSGCPPVRLLS